VQFDVFISYSSRDKAAADAACAALENAGIRCWIAPRDILPGADWGAAIMEALDSCRALVLIFSSHANSSPQIRREVEHVVGRGTPVIPVRIEDSMPTKAMAYFMGSVHWLDALTSPLEQHLRRLADSLKSLLAVDAPSPIGVAQPERRGAVATTAVPMAGVAPAANAASGAVPASPKRLLAMKVAVLVSTAIGILLSIGTIVAPPMITWLPAVAALAFISYWFVYRNLTVQTQIAKISALACGLVWAYFAIWNASAKIISLVAIEGICAGCMLYVAAELSRVK